MLGVHLLFFRVHWGSLEVIGGLFGVQLEFDGIMGVYWDVIGGY